MRNLTLYFLCLILAIAASCESEDEQTRYDQKESIYFGYSYTIDLLEKDALKLYPKGIQDPRSTIYSFAAEMKAVDTVWVPLTVSGKRTGYAREYKVKVVDTGTTAEASLHYEPFADHYTVPADSGEAYLPVVLYSKDPRMEDATFVLNLELVPSADFDINIKGHTQASVAFSNRFERPVWWTQWQGEFGSYTRTKHALYMISVYDVEDKDLVPNMEGDNTFYIPYDLFLISKFKALLVDPLLWVTNNPTFRRDSVSPGVYNFYNAKNEFKKYTLKLNAADGKYYFIDEYEKPVSTDF